MFNRVGDNIDSIAATFARTEDLDKLLDKIGTDSIEVMIAHGCPEQDMKPLIKALLSHVGARVVSVSRVRQAQGMTLNYPMIHPMCGTQAALLTGGQSARHVD